jgi:hypothetical protein
VRYGARRETKPCAHQHDREPDGVRRRYLDAPGPVGEAFGVDIIRDPLAVYLSRLMGARDVALAWELLVTEGEAQRKWLIACTVCDAADMLAAIAAGRNGFSKRTTAMVLGASLGPMVRGAIALREQ